MPEKTAGERLNTAVFYGVVLLLAWLVFRVFEPFLVPLGWAAVLVVFFHPWHARLQERLGRTSAAAVSTAGVTLILIVPVLLLMTLFVRQGIEAVRGIQHAMAVGQVPSVARAWAWLTQHARLEGGVDLPTLVQRGAEQVGAFLASELGAVVRNVAVFLFELFVTLFALFYFFRDADSIVQAVRRLLPFEEGLREKMLGGARELIYASVTTSLIIASVQGLLGGTAFAVVGLRAPVFWGIVMGFLALLPVVGSWPVWVPAAIWLASTGHWARGLVLVAICLGLVGAVDNFLRPALISGRAQLNGLVVFIGVLGGIGVFGVLGVFLGPIVVAAAASVLDVYSRREQPA